MYQHNIETQQERFCKGNMNTTTFFKVHDTKKVDLKKVKDFEELLRILEVVLSNGGDIKMTIDLIEKLDLHHLVIE